MTKPQDYFAFTDTEQIVKIGTFNDISEAMDAEPGNTHWIFSREGLELLKARIEEALK